MGARSGGGASGGMGSGSRSGGNDFAREAVTHPMFAAWNKQALDNTMASIDANIKDPKMRAEMKQLVQRMHDEMGGLPGGKDGITVKIGTNKDVPKQGRPNFWFGLNHGNTVTLNKKYFGHGYDHAEFIMKSSTSHGSQVKTNKPAIQVLAHEIGHGYYHSLSGKGQSQVSAVFSQFKASKSTKGWGSYSKTSPSEFYAEGVAKALLGGSDKWTKALGKIK